MKWDARDERVRNDDTLREYAALSQTFVCICFVLRLNHVGARIARSFAIPASISLSRPQGALDSGSKYNVAHWPVTNLREQNVTEGKRKRTQQS